MHLTAFDSIVIFSILFKIGIGIGLYFFSKPNTLDFNVKFISYSLFSNAIRYIFLLIYAKTTFSIYFSIADFFQFLSGLLIVESVTFRFRNSTFLKIYYFLSLMLVFVSLSFHILQLNMPYVTLPSSIINAISFFAFGVMAIKSKVIPKKHSQALLIVCILISIHRLDFPFLWDVSWFKPWGVMINSGLFFCLGIIVMYTGFAMSQTKIQDTLAELEELQSNLKETNVQLLIMNNQLPAIVYTIEFSPNPKLTYISSKIEDITGFSPWEIHQSPSFFGNIIHEGDKNNLLELYNGISPITLRFIHKNGDTIWTEHYSNISEDLLDAHKRLDVVALDITANKKVELFLADEKNVNSTVFDNASSYLIITNAQGKIQTMNNASESMLGKSRSQIFGRYIYDVLLLPEDRKSLQDIIEDVEEFKKIAESLILRCPGVDQKIKYVDWRLGIIKNEKGKPEKIIWIGIDQTLRRSAEIELRILNKNLENKVKERTQELQSSNEDLNLALQALRDTQEKLIQTEKLASLGQLISGISHEINNPIGVIKASIETIHAEWEEDLKSEERTTIPDYINAVSDFPTENTSLTTGANSRKIRKDIQLILNSKGILLSEDLSETLVDGGIIHINETLVDYLKKMNMESDLKLLRKILIIRRATTHIQHSIKRLSRITYTLKNFSGLQSDTSLSIYSLEDTILTALTVYKDFFGRDITLKKDFLYNGQVLCASSDLVQLWSQLIWNSIQAMGVKGELTITTKTINSEFVEVSIIDTGSGILKENQSKVFLPFYTTKDSGDGLGLGLYLAKEICNRHRADISFESSIHGTTFKVIFPIPYEETVVQEGRKDTIIK